MSYIHDNIPQQWGVTAPISTDPPAQYEIKLTEALVTTLHDYGLFESEQEAHNRITVLNKLNLITKEFVYRVGILQGLSEETAKQAGGKVFTFGSYKLGVHGADADIDTLCVFPKHVEREHFFKIMYEMLDKRPEVTELTSVVDAYVPVIKMRFSGIPIDFVCARLLSLSVVPDDLDLSNNTLLLGLDERCIRSLNGSRVTDDILRLVPSMPVFRLALRTIKLWAKKRAIYSNIMGFLGGVAWAMLVARVCQMYPNTCAASIVSRFFDIMYLWEWPQPVLLKPMKDGPLPIRQWNPKLFPADKNHRMPIITPAYPSMCATHNVTDSTRDIMLEEFNKTGEIAKKIKIGTGKWKDLFVESDFFQIYNHYLEIVASSYSSQQQLQWSGLVESRIRQLVLKLELVDLLQLAHPYIHGIDKVHYCITDQECWDVAHGNFHFLERTFPTHGGISEEDHINSLNLTAEEKNNVKSIYTTTFYIGLKLERATTTTTTAAETSQDDTNSRKSPRKLDLVWPTTEFLKSAKMWDRFDQRKMGITIKSVKGSNLPDELGGELRKQRRLLQAAAVEASKNNSTRSNSNSSKMTNCSTPSSTAADSPNTTEFIVDDKQ